MEEKEARGARENVWLKEENICQQEVIGMLKEERSKYQEDVMQVKQDKVSG